MVFRVLAHADVADRSRHQNSLGAFERTQHDLDWKLAPILAPSDEFKACADLLGERIRRGAKVVRNQPLGKSFRNDVLHLLTDEFITAIPELLFRLQI